MGCRHKIDSVRLGRMGAVCRCPEADQDSVPLGEQVSETE